MEAAWSWEWRNGDPEDYQLRAFQGMPPELRQFFLSGRHFLIPRPQFQVVHCSVTIGLFGSAPSMHWLPFDVGSSLSKLPSESQTRGQQGRPTLLWFGGDFSFLRELASFRF